MNTMIANTTDLLSVPKVNDLPKSSVKPLNDVFTKMLQQRKVADRRQDRQEVRKTADTATGKQDNNAISEKMDSTVKQEQKLEETVVRDEKRVQKKSDRKVSGKKESNSSDRLEKIDTFLADLDSEINKDDPDVKMLGDLLRKLDALVKVLEKTGEKAEAGKLKKGLEAVGKQLKNLLKNSEAPFTGKLKQQLAEIVKTAGKLHDRLKKTSGKTNSVLTMDMLEQVVRGEFGEKQTLLSGSTKAGKRSRANRKVQSQAKLTVVQQKGQPNAGAEWQGRVSKTAEGMDPQQLTSDHNFKKSLSETVSAKTGGKTSALTSPRKIFSQIVERAQVTHRSGMSEMKLQLKPRALGKVRMKLTLKDGAVTARVSVANSEVREMLAKNLDMLGQELREAGINLKNLDISQQGQGGNRGSNGEPDRGIDPLSGMSVGTSDVMASESRSTVQHSGDIDVVA